MIPFDESVLPSEASHPDAELMAAYLDANLSDIQRREVMTHLAQCAQCREEVRAVRRLLDAPGPSDRGKRWAGLAAAAVLVTVVGAQVAIQGGPPTGAPDGATDAGHATAGIVRAADDALPPDASLEPLSATSRFEPRNGRQQMLLAWRTSAEATRYALHVYTESGELKAEQSRTDTSVVLDVHEWPSGTRYFWSVDALYRDGRIRSTGMLPLVMP